MPTNLAIDDKLIKEAVEIGKHKTKKAAVTEALQEYILKRKQTMVREIFGKIDYDTSYNYKKQRKVK
ncbi:MAG: type II toxin-antitoxin system VapB family antitoxin [Bacteroidetes bacterium]|nr:type II toxin-antitoxin system VapB family antitoxin [Bacteroidota bacterium]